MRIATAQQRLVRAFVLEHHLQDAGIQGRRIHHREIIGQRAAAQGARSDALPDERLLFVQVRPEDRLTPALDQVGTRPLSAIISRTTATTSGSASLS